MSDELDDVERRLGDLFASVGEPEGLRGRWQAAGASGAPRGRGWLSRLLLGAPGERRLRPLAAALLVPLLVLAVAGGFGLHAQLSGTGSGGPGPLARAQAGMAFDAAHGDVVMFGGSGMGGALDDTWTWDGSGWTQQHPSVSPPAMPAPVLADDPATGRVLLTGVPAGGSAAVQTWSWDGSTWRAEHPAHTPSGVATSMAADPATHQTVLVTLVAHVGLVMGGDQSPAAGVPAEPMAPIAPAVDLWTWDGHDWAVLLEPPVATTSLRLAWDESSQHVVLLAAPSGCAGGASISVSGPSGPPKAGWSGYAPATVAPHIVIATPAAPAPAEPTGLPQAPGPRPAPAMPVTTCAFSSTSASGGAATSTAGQGASLFAWDGRAWHDASLKTMPVLKGTVQLSEDPTGGGLLAGSAGAWWRISGGSARVLTGGAALAGRFGAALAPDPAHHAVVLFGGQAGRGFGDDTWTWDGTSWTQRGGSLEPIPGVPSSSPGVQHLCSTGSPLSSVTSGDRTTYTTSWASGPCATLPVTVTLEDGNTTHLAVQGNPIAIRAGARQLSFTWSNWCGSGPVSLRLDWPGLDWVQQITPPPCGSSAQPSVLAAAAGGHPGVTGP